MTRKKKKKQGISFLWVKPVAMAIIFFLGIGFTVNIIEAFLEQAGGISEEGLIFGLSPFRFYLICLCVLVAAFAVLAGSWKSAKDELLEKLD